MGSCNHESIGAKHLPILDQVKHESIMIKYAELCIWVTLDLSFTCHVSAHMHPEWLVLQLKIFRHHLVIQRWNLVLQVALDHLS